jgi:hypothetical protein
VLLWSFFQCIFLLSFFLECTAQREKEDFQNITMNEWGAGDEGDFSAGVCFV